MKRDPDTCHVYMAWWSKAYISALIITFLFSFREMCPAFPQAVDMLSSSINSVFFARSALVENPFLTVMRKQTAEKANMRAKRNLMGCCVRRSRVSV